ncbi:papain-like cysteine protease family protein [Azospirillum himalayense]|uniref:Papain-like cysteine protease family protein n=1 Tax=Azospirillum himalayense TaxID=654847 RepID=A0ABW0GAK6_9PROT
MALVTLSIPFIGQELRYNCWHASARMVLAYYGKDPGWNLGRVGQRAYSDNFGMWGREEIRSFCWEWALTPVDLARPNQKRPTDFTTLLKGYGPVLFWVNKPRVGWQNIPEAKQDSYGHAVVLTGVDDDIDVVFLNDPEQDGNIGVARSLFVDSVQWALPENGAVYSHSSAPAYGLPTGLITGSGGGRCELTRPTH